MTITELKAAMSVYKKELDSRTQLATLEAKAELVALLGTLDARFISLKAGPGVLAETSTLLAPFKAMVAVVVTPPTVPQYCWFADRQ